MPPVTHELLAIERNRKLQAQKLTNEVMTTFQKKQHLLGSKLVTLVPTDENAQIETREQSDLNTTVKKELDWLSEILADSFDSSHHLAHVNTLNRADVIVNDLVFLKNVPATELLELKKRLEHLKDLISAIPTLDPAKGFTPDTAKGECVFVAREDIRTSTKKVKKVLVMAPATDKHPAQTQVYDADEPVGRLITKEWSGMITPAQKAKMLERIEDVIRAVVAARAKANAAQVPEGLDKIGKKITDYLFAI